MFLIESLAVFLSSLLLVLLVRNNAERWGMIDIPNSRSAHREHTPRGAGIGLFLSVALMVLLFNHEMVFSHFLVFTAILMVFVIGLLDDHNDTSPNTKFLFIIVGTCLLYFDGVAITELGVFFGVNLSLGWLALPFTVFAVTGFTNALNLIDGLDGLAGTVSIVILSGFFFLGYTYHDLFMLVLSGSFMAALGAFLLYNWHPASIFMGDSGSLTLGFVISLLAVKSLAYLPTVSVLFVAAIPILDTLVVMIRRKRNGRSMFSADHCHIHHILKQFFAEDTPRTVLFLGVLQAIYTFTGLQFSKEADEGALLVLFILNVILLYLFLGAMVKRQKRDC